MLTSERIKVWSNAQPGRMLALIFYELWHHDIVEPL